jgi:hypothetical protein
MRTKGAVDPIPPYDLSDVIGPGSVFASGERIRGMQIPSNDEASGFGMTLKMVFADFSDLVIRGPMRDRLKSSAAQGQNPGEYAQCVAGHGRAGRHAGRQAGREILTARHSHRGSLFARHSGKSRALPLSLDLSPGHASLDSA